MTILYMVLLTAKTCDIKVLAVIAYHSTPPPLVMTSLGVATCSYLGLIDVGTGADGVDVARVSPDNPFRGKRRWFLVLLMEGDEYFWVR